MTGISLIDDSPVHSLPLTGVRVDQMIPLTSNRFLINGQNGIISDRLTVQKMHDDKKNSLRERERERERDENRESFFSPFFFGTSALCAP